LQPANSVPTASFAPVFAPDEAADSADIPPFNAVFASDAPPGRLDSDKSLIIAPLISDL
jgi:hypothetical protein